VHTSNVKYKNERRIWNGENRYTALTIRSQLVFLAGFNSSCCGSQIIEEIKDNWMTREENQITSREEDFNKLVYLHGAICEALRLYPLGSNKKQR